MKKLLENWNTYLTEALGNFEVDLLLRTEPEMKLQGDIFEKIRAIEGITVIKATEKSRTDDSGNKVIKLLIRFVINPDFGFSYLEKVKEEIKSLRDAEGDRIISVKILHRPQPTEKK